MQSSLLPCYLVPLRPKYLPQQLFSNALGLCSSLSVRDHASQPYEKKKHGALSIFQTLLVQYLVKKKKDQSLMDPEGSLPRSQNPMQGSYSEARDLSARTHTPF
jgi:hypothetical protein